MIIHHMSDGTIRKSIEGVRIPTKFDSVYALAYKKRVKGEKQNGNSDSSRSINKK